MNNITLIQWNVGFGANPELICRELKKNISGPYIITLMEIVPAKLPAFLKAFPEAETAYSLDYRPPGKYDTRKRKLGVLKCSSDGES